MRIAIPDWNGQVSPVFDYAQRLLVIDTCDGVETGRQKTALVQFDLGRRALQLADLGVELLICGAISRPLEAAIKAQGVRIKRHVCGETKQILQTFLDRGHIPERFLMPGCSEHSKEPSMGKPPHARSGKLDPVKGGVTESRKKKV